MGGEGNGPLFPDERPVGVILAGFNLLAVDLTALRLMGFDWKKVRWARDLVEHRQFDFFVKNAGDIRVRSNKKEFTEPFTTKRRLLDFKPHPGWKGHIELE